MVNYAEEIERIGEESRRRSAILLQELEETRQHSAAVERELAERSAIEMREFWEEHAEEIAKAQAEVEEKERLEAEAREQREAIARSIAARKAHGVVTPVDEDDDPEGEYYRRKSWLI
jgi:predicted RNA-binding Zn ribbon-like protein